MRAMKHVICMKKSINKAIPAYKANALTAGISVRAPRKKQVNSETDDKSIDGATFPVTRPTCSVCVSEDPLGSLWYVCTRMNMLSTPTANTRKGMISKMISVAGTPANPNTPMEAATDKRTIIIPPRPRLILLSTYNVKNTCCMVNPEEQAKWRMYVSYLCFYVFKERSTIMRTFFETD